MNSKLKKIVFILMIFSLIGLSVITAADATINLSSNKQYIRGFGASSAWSGALSDSIMDSLYKNLGYSILRLRIEEGIGDNWKTGNFSQWSAELSNAKKASARGAIVFASPWNPPASMQESFSKSGDSNAKRLRYDKYTEYVQYLNAYVKYMSDNGVNLYAISVQNEPDYANDWTWWTPQEMLNFMKNNAGSINCKVMAPESFQYLKNMSDPILNDETALSNMDILGFHLYGTPLSQFSYSLYQQKSAGKELWETEHYFDDDNPGTLMNMAKEIHDCFVTGSVNAYVYWWIPWGNGLCTTSGTLYKRAYVLGQFAKFIRPGYYRVDTASNPQTNVYVSAYKGDTKAVIVAINSGTSAVTQNFAFQNGTVSSVTPYVTSSSENVAAKSVISVNGSLFSASLPAQSITTFVGNLSDVPPTVTPIPTPTPGPQSAFLQIEAENFSSQFGIQTETCNEGGQDVGYIQNGDYIAFNNVDFGSGAASFKARVASATSGGNIEIRLDSNTGTTIGICQVASTGDWQTWTTVNCSVNGASGIHNLYLVFTGGSDYLFNLNWFQFSAGVTPTPTPTNPNTLGDVNGDGNITITDALLIAQYSVGIIPAVFISANADVNKDGNIDIIDALMVSQYTVGLITGF